MRKVSYAQFVSDMVIQKKAAQSKQTDTPQGAPSTIDWPLATVLTCLLLFGLVMVFSASYPWAMENQDSPFYYVFRQIRWLGLGLVALVGAALFPYRLWERWSIPLGLLGLVALVAVLWLGDTRFGATRTFFSGRVQPSELVKVIFLIYISNWLASKGNRLKEINYGLVPYGVLIGGIAVLIVLQPDISTTVLIVTTALIVFFLAGAELKQLFLIGMVAIITFWLVITRYPHASRRVRALLESIRDPLNSPEWQVTQASQAIVKGGPLGVGLGNSTEKLPGNLPLSWSDNIFAIIGEELGLLGALLVIFLFMLFVYRGLRIASESPDMFGSLLAIGITSLIILQAMIHIAVAVAFAPPTGVTLPFISFGGSSLVTSMGAAGILLNISRYRGQSSPEPTSRQPTYAPFHFGRRNRRPRLSGSRRHRTIAKQPNQHTGRRTGTRS